MLRKILPVVVLILAVSAAMAADSGHVKATLTAAEIVEKNVQARGGLQAWRAVQTLSFEGKMGAGGNRQAPIPASLEANKKNATLPKRLSEEAQLPFKMQLRRPRQVRFEIQFNGQTAVQVYDGAQGWKLRPFLNRQNVDLFTADELKVASMQPELDGPLVDYAAKGTRIELKGMEKVDDRDTYKLALTMKNGEAIHVWIDAQTFLETKIEGQPRQLDGKFHPVEVYYEDYRQISGLQIPFILETRVLPIADETAKTKDVSSQSEKIVIEKVVVNPKLEASLFTKPVVQTASTLH
jgi:hypothetical protein